MFPVIISFANRRISLSELLGSKQDRIITKNYQLIDILSVVDNIKGTVLINYKYTPKQIDKLELQSDNYRGLFFIYNSILEEIANSNSKIKHS